MADLSFSEPRKAGAPQVETAEPRQQELLSDLEKQAIRQTADLWNTLVLIVGDGRTRDADLAELASHIHGIQHTVMSQAAARCYPGLLRRLGHTLSREKG